MYGVAVSSVYQPRSWPSVFELSFGTHAQQLARTWAQFGNVQSTTRGDASGLEHVRLNAWTTHKS